MVHVLGHGMGISQEGASVWTFAVWLVMVEWVVCCVTVVLHSHADADFDDHLPSSTSSLRIHFTGALQRVSVLNASLIEQSSSQMCLIYISVHPLYWSWSNDHEWHDIDMFRKLKSCCNSSQRLLQRWRNRDHDCEILGARDRSGHAWHGHFVRYNNFELMYWSWYIDRARRTYASKSPSMRDRCIYTWLNCFNIKIKWKTLN